MPSRHAAPDSPRIGRFAATLEPITVSLLSHPSRTYIAATWVHVTFVTPLTLLGAGKSMGATWGNGCR